MKIMRKTIEVDLILDEVNAMLLNTPDDFRERRYGMIAVIEKILHDSDRYNGYRYLCPYMMEKSESGITPGIIFDESPNCDHIYPDESRRLYYKKPKTQKIK
jgi:hypothetical protein